MDQELLRKMKIGCIGALTPILINLLIVDLQTALSNFTVISALSYAVRVVALCGAACIVVYLNSDESRPVKIFQLGIAAPALLTGMINGAAIANKQNTSPPPTTQTKPGAFENQRGTSFAFQELFIISRAQAQNVSTPLIAQDCSRPKDLSVSQQVLKGLIGIVPDNHWFVVVGSNPTAESALSDANVLNRKFAGRFDALICAPLGGADSRFRVVIGEYLTYPDATNLKLKAIKAGLPEDTWVWNPILTTK